MTVFRRWCSAQRAQRPRSLSRPAAPQSQHEYASPPPEHGPQTRSPCGPVPGGPATDRHRPARARFGTHTPVTAGTDRAQRPVGMHRARLTAHGAIAHWPWPARAANWHACRELARPLTAAGGAGGDRPLPAVSAQARVIGAAAPPDDGAQLAAARAEPPRRLVTPPANRPGVADMVHWPKLPAARAGPGWRAVAARADRPGVSTRRHSGPGSAPRAVAEPVRVGVVTAEANRPGR